MFLNKTNKGHCLTQTTHTPRSTTLSVSSNSMATAAAAPPLYASSSSSSSSFSTKSSSPNKPLFNNIFFLRPPLPSTKLKTTTATTPRLSVSAAATSAVELGEAPQSSTPAKTLPFRVGHGFDLHRLEPGYPLIIGGIDIPHDRGCEAHSDGNFVISPTLAWVIS